MDLIPESQLNLRTVTADPIGEIIRSSTVMREMTLVVRTRLIAELIIKIDELEDQGEKTFSRNMMLGIGSSFSMAAAIASTGALAPVAGICLSVSALGSWGACMYEVFTENLKLEPIRDTLKRLSLALKSAPTDKWAAVWAVAGDDIFVYALKEATKGEIVRNQLVQLGNDRPIDRAIDCVAAFKGLTYEEVTASARAMLSGKNPASAIQLRPPAKPQQSFEAIDVAVAIGADLAEGVERAKEERKAALKVEPPVQPVTRIQPPVLPTVDVVDKRTQDIVELILKVTNSLTFIGAQRCGKSYLMALASRIGLQTGRFTKVSVISSLTKAGEDSEYWKHCTTQAFYDLKRVINKVEYYEEYLQVIRDFKATATAENPQLLIIDEFSFLAQCLGQDKDTEAAEELAIELINLATVCGSASEKNGWYVWLGTPQGNVTNIPTELRPVMKQFSLVMAAIAPGVTIPTSTGGNVTWDDTIFTDTERNFPVLKGRMPPRGAAKDLSERIVFLNGKWYKSSKYTLESVVDAVDQTQFKQELASRDALSSDERKSLKTAVAVQEKSRADKLAEEMIAKLESSQSRSLEEFIEYELGAGDRISEVKPRIIAVLRKYNRQDLLKRFAAN
jgi:hypothetical protein